MITKTKSQKPITSGSRRKVSKTNISAASKKNRYSLSRMVGRRQKAKVAGFARPSLLVKLLFIATFGVVGAVALLITQAATASLVINNSTTGSAANQFNFSANWGTIRTVGAYKDDEHFSATANATYQVKFTGTQIKVFSMKHPNYGIGAYSIDGGPETLVDHYSSKREFNFLAFTSKTLSYGEHTLKLRVTGTKQAASKGAFVVADKVEVTGANAVSLKKPKLIKASFSYPSARYVADNIAEIKKLPMDGLIVTMGGAQAYSFNIQTTTPITYEQIKAELAPLATVDKGSLTDNFVIVHARGSDGMAGDYTVQTQNFANLARAAKEVGLKGIVYDPESYREGVWNWPEHCPSGTLLVCQATARDRGKRIMSAIIGQWPEAIVLSYIGPGVSDPKTVYEYNSLKRDPIYWDGSTVYEMKGHFVVGMVEATVGTKAKVIDGSEIYTLRTDQEHSVVYNWNKRGLAEKGTTIPNSIRSSYPSLISVGIGVYDQPYGGAPMDLNIWKQSIQLAGRYVDDYVWLYTERYDWFGNHPALPRVPQDWLDATTAAKNSFVAK